MYKLIVFSIIGNYRDPKKFISNMFQFFINLSGDKSQSNIISEAIHLCDGLMASGFSPELYCMLIFLNKHFVE